jgi:hypothetical protein
MLKVNDLSELCYKSELDLETLPLTQTSILESSWHKVSTTALNNDTLQFEIAGDDTHYLDLSNSYIFLNLSIIDKQKLSAKDYDQNMSIVKTENAETHNYHCYPSNNFLHSIFKSADVKINSTTVESCSNYAYRSYIEDLLNYDTQTKKSMLNAQLWYDDDYGKFDAVDTEDKITNNGAKERRTKIKNKKLTLFGRLHLDTFNMIRNIIANQKITVVLTKNSNKFYLMQNSDSDLFTLNINDAYLLVRKNKISFEQKLVHTTLLNKSFAKYPYTRVLVKTHVMNKGVTHKLSSLQSGVVPNRIIFGFVDEKAYTGNFKKNPFNFIKLDIATFNLKVASESIPYSDGLDLSTQTDNDNTVVGYHTLMNNLNTSPTISLNEYSNGSYFLCFNLSQDGCNADHYNPLREGNVEANITLNTWPDNIDNIMLIYYMEFDNILQVDKMGLAIVGNNIV